MHRYVSAFELNPVGTHFVDLGQDFSSTDVSALPANAVERYVTRPRISRLRAAAQAVALSRGDPVISHLPRLTAAISGMQMLSGNRSRHLAFSFNFTRLPTGASLAMFRRALGRVDQFITFSRYEVELYAAHFGIEAGRIRPLLWAQSPPALAIEPTPFSGQDYVCALGGEGRDYATLSETARLLPDINFVVIARHDNLIGTGAPNVRVLCDIPAPMAWRIAQESRLMVMPLLTRDTCCGHITLVAAKLLGIPTVATFSLATRDYIQDDQTCPPSDPQALAELIRGAYANHEALRDAARGHVDHATVIHDRDRWRGAIRDFILDI